MDSKKNQNYLHGAIILTVAVIAVKILGAFYKITLGVILDDEGFGLFTIAYNLYAVVLQLSTAGLPVAVARMISEADSLNRPGQVKKTYAISMTAFAVLGTLGTAAMFLYPTELAIFMENVRASQSIQVLAPAIILCCVLSGFRGYSQGLSDMRPTAVSQVIEVAGKLVFGIALVFIFRNRGASSAILSSYAISGVSVGSLIACVYIGFAVSKRMKTEKLRVYGGELDSSVERGSSVLWKLCKIGVPIALSSSIMAIIALLNTKLIQNRLIAVNVPEKIATGLFGVYSKAQTLYNLPLSLITPLTISVIPAISGFLATKKYGDAKEVTESSMRITAILALPMAIGLSVLAGPVMNGLYSGSGEQGTGLLVLMGLASFFLCFSMISTSVLQASRHQVAPAITMIVGGAVNVALNWYLVGNPNSGDPTSNIYGAAIGILVSNIIMFVLNLIFVMTMLPEKPSLGKVFLRPVLNALVMGAAAWLVYPAALKIIGAGPSPSTLMTIIALGAAVLVGVVIYLVLTIITKAITVADMRLIPKGEKLAKLLRIREG